MRNALILHGMPSEEEYHLPGGQTQSEHHWLPWLKGELLARGIQAKAPELPHPYAPSYEDWRSVLDEFDIGEDTALIGHSAGAGLIARWLSEEKRRVGKVALVAPWLDPKPRTLQNGFMEFSVDTEAEMRAKTILIFSSDDDDEDIQQSVAILKDSWPGARHIELSGKGHLDLEGLGTREFPELLEALLEN